MNPGFPPQFIPAKAGAGMTTFYEVVNLGAGVNYSVNDIYALLAEMLGVHIPPVRNPDLPGEAETTLADITAARKLGWAPKTALRSGLEHAIAYIKSEMEKGNI